jgi:glutathione S-transferase
MPLGQLPALEYDGAVLSQSLTIARFLAKEFGLAGKNNLEQAQADMIIDAGNDLANCEYLIVNKLILTYY